ncbi:MAG: hypothetical protein AAGH15_21410 [Myxococcota bacterium]
MREPTFGRALLAVGVLCGACATDLGECPPFGPRDQAVRSDIVFFSNDGGTSDGIAMFAGQAILQQSCGNGGFCHSPNISASARRLAPAGLDFNVAPACTSVTACEEEEVERLRQSQATLFRWSELSFQEIERGTMPPAGLPDPGEPGAVFPEGRYFRTVTVDETTGSPTYADPIPLLYADDPDERAQARSLVRDWLACGAPVVERLEEPVIAGEPTDVLPGTDCGNETVGECIVRAPVDPPDPNWQSIFETVIVGGGCQGCHMPGNPFFEDAVIDYSDADTAYEQMFMRPAAGNDCEGRGGTLIVPNRPEESLFIEKFGFGDAISCGDRMPLGGSSIPANFLPAMERWIEDGALNDGPRDPVR